MKKEFRSQKLQEFRIASLLGIFPPAPMNGINQNRIKLSQLRTLVAVVEHGNLSEAALHLEISQSAVSHAIATLEEELGVSLLARGRNGAHLTPAGEGVIGYAQQVLQLLEKMVDEANSHKGIQGGQVRVAAFQSAAAHLYLQPQIYRNPMSAGKSGKRYRI
jgi:DNA-binding transcriptional LysR family regulator